MLLWMVWKDALALMRVCTSRCQASEWSSFFALDRPPKILNRPPFFSSDYPAFRGVNVDLDFGGGEIVALVGLVEVFQEEPAVLVLDQFELLFGFIEIGKPDLELGGLVASETVGPGFGGVAAASV